MSQTKALFVLAGSVLAFGASAQAAEPAANRDEIRAIVAEMLADADSRSSLLQGGGTAGRDEKGFFIGSGDGNYKLNIGGFVQNTYFLNFRDDENADGNPGTGQPNEFEPGFQIKRARLEFTGNVISPDFKFGVTEELSNGAAGTASLKDAWWDYNLGNGWYIKGGQFRLGFLREELIGDTYQLASERSAVNSVFTQDRSQGLEFGYRDEQFRASLALSDGFNSDNTPFTTAPALPSTAAEADWGLTFRAEWNFMGSTKTLKDFTSMADGEWAAMVGAAVHFQQSANTQLNTDVDTDYLTYTIDFQIEGAGFNGFIAFVGNNTEISPGNAGSNDSDADDYGLVAQIGYRFDKFEPFVRYEGIYLDNDADTGRTFAATQDENINFLTFGANYYFAGHAAKFTADVSWCFDQTNGIAGLGGIPVGTGSYIGSSTGFIGSNEDDEVVLRFQFQFMF
ncbi:MAG: hypothetical protein JNK35_01000 [Phycisphaerae bacterium]|nr:hypothetical protein [Phycisphaerae bacterium]